MPREHKKSKSSASVKSSFKNRHSIDNWQQSAGYELKSKNSDKYGDWCCTCRGKDRNINLIRY